MITRRVLGGGALAGLLALAALVPVPARAGLTHEVGVYSNFFSPSLREAIAGDTIRFFALEGGHQVKAFSNATFDSGPLAINETFSVPYAGGTIRYYCPNHAALSGGLRCSGMCGIITDDPDIDIEPPRVSIVTPRAGAIIVPVPTVEDTAVRNRVLLEVDASDNVRVDGVAMRLYDNTGRAIEITDPCDTCGQKTVRWTARPHLLPGTYLAEAVAVDSSGNLYTTPRRTFFVL